MNRITLRSFDETGKLRANAAFDKLRKFDSARNCRVWKFRLAGELHCDFDGEQEFDKIPTINSSIGLGDSGLVWTELETIN